MLTVILRVTTKKTTQNNRTKETKEVNQYTGKYPFNKKALI